jgi:hypothetical protein
VFVFAGCGGGGSGGAGPGGAYSCRATVPGGDGGTGTLALCLDASGGRAEDMASNRQQCISQGNMFVSEPCPRASAVGGCRQSPAGTGAVLTTWYYAASGATSEDVRMICEGLASIAPASLMIEFVLP